MLTESSLEEGGGSGSGAARLKVEMELASEKKCLIFLKKRFSVFSYQLSPIHVTCLHFERRKLCCSMGISPSGVSPRPANLGNPVTFWVLGQIETDRINFGLNMKRMRRTGSFGSD